MGGFANYHSNSGTWRKGNSVRLLGPKDRLDIASNLIARSLIIASFEGSSCPSSYRKASMRCWYRCNVSQSHVNLLFDHGPVLAALGHQFRVSARLANAAIFDD